MSSPEAEPQVEAPRLTRFHIAAIVVILVGALAFRLAIVSEWHVPAGDGLQYFSLSQQLAKDGRFAYKPAPAKLAYTRMPGYPLFLAYLAVRKVVPIETHLVRATAANVVLDLGTALLVVLILRRLARRRATLFIGLIAAALYPLLILLSCFALTETLAVFLATLELYLALQAMRGRFFLYCILTGIVAGLAQLVRTDAVTVAPAVLVAILSAETSWRRRVAGLALCAAAALLVFIPWPIRNQVQFGKPYPIGLNARNSAGDPQPGSPLTWARTWASGAQGEAYFDVCIYFEGPLDPNRPGLLLPVMYDDPVERQQVVELFQKYNREHLSPAVAKGFDDLASARAKRHPFRTYVTLPLKRIVRLWAPVPEWELPIRVRFLHLPELRPWFGRIDLLVFGFAIVGFAGLVAAGRGSRRRRWAVILLLPIVCRTVLYGYVIPTGVNERYLVEVIPILLVLASVGVEFAGGGARRLVGRLRPKASAARP